MHPPLTLRKYLKIIDAYEHVANILMQGNLVCKIDLKRPVKSTHEMRTCIGHMSIGLFILANLLTGIEINQWRAGWVGWFSTADVLCVSPEVGNT